MLVLLVIFMVTAPIIQQGVAINLPKVKAEALPGKEEQFVVSITRGSEIYLNDAKMSPAELTGQAESDFAGASRPPGFYPRRRSGAIRRGDSHHGGD